MPLPPDPPPANDQPCGLIEILVRALGAAHERRRHLVLAGADEDRLGADRRLAAAIGRRHRRELVVEQRDALAVHRDVDVLEAGVLAGVEGHLDLVLGVSRERVLHHHAAARAVGRALDVVPRVLGHVARVGVGRVDGRRRAIAHRDAADGGGGVQVRLQQRRRQRLRVGDVVEVRALGVERQPVAGVDFDAEHLANRALVLGTVQALERAAAGIGRLGGGGIERGLERGDQRRLHRGSGTLRGARRHHARLQLDDHLLRDLGMLCRLRHIERCQRQPGRRTTLVVAGRAVLGDDRVVFGTVRGRGRAGAHRRNRRPRSRRGGRRLRGGLRCRRTCRSCARGRPLGR